MSKKRHGQTAEEWATGQFADADCPACGRGIDHHYIVPAPGLDVWFAQCYEQPKVINTILLWAVDESEYLTDDDDGVETMVTRYRRSKKLQGAELPADKPKKKDKGGKEAIIYTAADFGVISTDEELSAYLDGELTKFVGKTPVKEQL